MAPQKGMDSIKLLKTLNAVFSATYIAALLSGVSASPIILDINSARFAQIGNYSHSVDGTEGTGLGTTNYIYNLVGTGDPHQNYIITQQGNSVISCSPGAKTEMSKGITTTWGVTAGSSISLGELGSFDPLGFSVEESVEYSTSQSFDCIPSAQTACILVYQAVTAFTVDVTMTTTSTSGETTSEDLGQTKIYAPNANGLGSTAALGIINVDADVRQCLGEVDRVVGYYCGPPGTAEEYWVQGGTKDPGPWQADYQAHLNPPPSQCAPVIEASHFVN